MQVQFKKIDSAHRPLSSNTGAFTAGALITFDVVVKESISHIDLPSCSLKSGDIPPSLWL